MFVGGVDRQFARLECWSGKGLDPEEYLGRCHSQTDDDCPDTAQYPDHLHLSCPQNCTFRVIGAEGVRCTRWLGVWCYLVPSLPTVPDDPTQAIVPKKRNVPIVVSGGGFVTPQILFKLATDVVERLLFTLQLNRAA